VIAGPTARPCAVHLVRHGNPPASFERFIESYRRCDAGVDHRLVLLCKGFPDETALAPILERLDGLRTERLMVPDDGFDLTAYRRAAACLAGSVACYLNSNSVLVADGWLGALVGALGDSIGIAGATGSWNSGNASARYELRLPGVYGEVFPDRAWYRAQVARMGAEGAADPDSGPLSRPPLRYVRTAYRLARAMAVFPPFPATHIRTNAFAVRSETMLRLRFPSLRSKARAWRLESGRGSITDQLAASGLGVVVVGRDGRSYAPTEWAESETFWQAEQRNLLVADNQTERYRLGDLDRRTMLAGLAWGTQARPAPPPGSS
jgi:hypothetical protein